MTETMKPCKWICKLEYKKLQWDPNSAKNAMVIVVWHLDWQNRKCAGWASSLVFKQVFWEIECIQWLTYWCFVRGLSIVVGKRKLLCQSREGSSSCLLVCAHTNASLIIKERATCSESESFVWFFGDSCGREMAPFMTLESLDCRRSIWPGQ